MGDPARRLLPALLVVLTLAGTALATAASLRYERAQADQRAAAEVERAADVIDLNMTVAMESLGNMAGFFDASGTVSAARFSEFSHRVLQRGRLNGVRWLERVPHTGRERYERLTGHAIVETAASGVRPASERREPDRGILPTSDHRNSPGW